MKELERPVGVAELRDHGASRHSRQMQRPIVHVQLVWLVESWALVEGGQSRLESPGVRDSLRES